MSAMFHDFIRIALGVFIIFISFLSVEWKHLYYYLFTLLIDILGWVQLILKAHHLSYEGEVSFWELQINTV